MKHHAAWNTGKARTDRAKRQKACRRNRNTFAAAFLEAFAGILFAGLRQRDAARASSANAKREKSHVDVRRRKRRAAPATSGHDCTDGSCSEGACSDGSCTP